MGRTEAVVCYLLEKARPNPISKTSLMKLCYFADLEGMRRFGRPLTEESWERADYGVVAYGIPNAARQIPGVDAFDYDTYSGKHGTNFCAGPEALAFRDELGMDDKAILDDIWSRHGHWQATALGSESKRTEPWIMAEASGDSRLDLSAMSPGPNARLDYFAKVLERVDLSVQGTPAEIDALEDETEAYMAPLRQAAIADANW